MESAAQSGQSAETGSGDLFRVDLLTCWLTVWTLRRRSEDLRRNELELPLLLFGRTACAKEATTHSPAGSLRSSLFAVKQWEKQNSCTTHTFICVCVCVREGMFLNTSHQLIMTFWLFSKVTICCTLPFCFIYYMKQQSLVQNLA